MVDYNAPLFVHPQKTWNKKTCERLAKRRPIDAYGNKMPQGYIPSYEIGNYAHGRVVRYNGGTVIDGEWYQGEEWPLPKLAKGFKFIFTHSWGYFIIKE